MLLTPKRHSLRCHSFVVHAFLRRMHTNVVDFRVMRRLCHREWNWQSVNHIPGIYDNGSHDHGMWHLTLTVYITAFMNGIIHQWFIYQNNGTICFCLQSPVFLKFLIQEKHMFFKLHSICVIWYTLSVKRNITSSGRCSLKSTASKLIIFGHK